MNFYDIVSEYVKYDRMDKKDKDNYELEEIRNKRRYYEKKIKEEVNETSDVEVLKHVLEDFKYILTVEEEFMINNRYFYLVKNDEEMLKSFIDIMYFWGPDYDEKIEAINKLIAEGNLREASDICMNIKY